MSRRAGASRSRSSRRARSCSTWRRRAGASCPPISGAEWKYFKWLNWQMGGLGPMLGQHGHFALYAEEKHPYAIGRYRQEALRLFGVMDKRLADRECLAGDYSIAGHGVLALDGHVQASGNRLGRRLPECPTLV